MPRLFRLNFGQSLRADSGAYYRGIQLLGRGKNADVYLVLATADESRGNFFALKILQDAEEADKRVAFDNERDLLNSLSHPSISGVIDHGIFTAGGSEWPFYVCNYYPTNLESIIQRGCSLPEKLAYALQLCSALAYLDHRDEPLIHCDVKPANVLVSGLSCVLADFGMVREGPTARMAAIGPSLHTYRSPDIVNNLNHGTPLTTKSDIFLLGLTLAHLFTGKNPCKPSAVGSDPVILEPLGPIEGEFGERIRNAIEWMLGRDSNNRPQASYLIDVWQGILFEAVDKLRVVDPRVY